MPRRWKQISLRAMLLLLLACSIPLAIWAAYFQPYFREQQTLAELQQSQSISATTEAVGPKWLQSIAGGKYAQRVVWVDIAGEFTDADLAKLHRFAHLKTIMIAQGPRISDDGLAALTRCRGISDLMLQDTQITDEGLRRLHELPNLRSLSIGSDRVTNDGLAHVGGLTELRELAINAKITDAGLPQLVQLKHLTTLRCFNIDKGSAQLRSQLNQPLLLKCENAPLSGVLELLADMQQISIRNDLPALQNAGVDLQHIFVTSASDERPLEECLQSILWPHKLNYLTERGGLVITTEEQAMRQQRHINALLRQLPNLRVVEIDL